MFKTENEANIIYNLRTSEDRLQQYERDKVQCRQSDERYLPIRKKKGIMHYIQCYTLLYNATNLEILPGLSATLTLLVWH